MNWERPGNRGGDFADRLIARHFAREGEDFLPHRLDLIHAEAEAHQFAAERHQSAAAHGAGRDAHQALKAPAHALAAG